MMRLESHPTAARMLLTAAAFGLAPCALGFGVAPAAVADPYPRVTSEELGRQCDEAGGRFLTTPRGAYECTFPDGSHIGCSSDPASKPCKYTPPPPPPPKQGSDVRVVPEINAPDTAPPSGSGSTPKVPPPLPDTAGNAG